MLRHTRPRMPFMFFMSVCPVAGGIGGDCSGSHPITRNQAYRRYTFTKKVNGGDIYDDY